MAIYETGSSPLFRRLPAELQENAAAQDHLWEYLNTLPIEEIGVPDYSPWLTRNMRDIKYRNLIYPLGKSLFVHLYPDMTDSRDYYMAIEPSLDPSLTGLMEQIDRRLVDYIDELKHASDAQE